MSALDSMERAFTDRLPVSGPSASFKELWAAAIMEDAISRTEHHYKTQGRIRHWMAFEARVLRPATTRTEAPPLSQLAGELDFNHPADVAAAVQQVKHRVSIFIRDVIAETIGREDDIEEEYAALKQAFE